MNIYITTGTHDFLKKIEAKYSGETMVTMINPNGSLLLHETMGKSVFNAPRKYEAIGASGKLPTKEGFVVMNNIPINEEERPLFEHQISNQGNQAANDAGFIALRILRPLTSNTYIIMTVWENEANYEKWKGSQSYFPSYDTKGTIDPQQKIFQSAPYISEYMITE
ncbi:antibiotic biosynthesis monooxygenase family protein [Neobacillus kokaensis]|uniref:Heme-degrading monooxygenase HmoB n=1 Tax=Neobacillus kokaensis TaxID=2759023 RepID=A0ABQ3N382_9BACI|nr:antibiotic biosynthesis monooxygenase [Neobacillus kokaensis]GHH98541.1 heme-degrading monooxygenase HmoB [Neobacillus kokaensis]